MYNNGTWLVRCSVASKVPPPEDLLLPYIYDVFLSHNSLLLVVQQKRGSLLIPHSERSYRE